VAGRRVAQAQGQAIDDESKKAFETVIGRLDAIVTHLDEQNASHDRLMGKVDRLGVKVDQLAVLARAGEEATTSLDALARRVAKLEAAQRGKE